MDAPGARVKLILMAQTTSSRNLGRLSEIAQVMVRHGFGYFLEAHKLTDLLPGRSAETRLAAATFLEERRWAALEMPSLPCPRMPFAQP